MMNLVCIAYWCVVLRDQRLIDDTPMLSEAATMVAAVLATFTSLGPNAEKARALLAAPQGHKQVGLSGNSLGRAAVRHGASKWYLSQTAAGTGGVTGMADEAVQAALQWAAGRIMENAERLVSPDSQSAVAACKEVVAMLQQLAGMQETFVEPPAPQKTIFRFAGAVQAAVNAAKAASVDDGVSELRATTPAHLACDDTCNVSGHARLHLPTCLCTYACLSMFVYGAWPLAFPIT